MMAVTCPRCARRFRLPPSRVGRGGARVRCSGCERWFEWRPGGERPSLPAEHEVRAEWRPFLEPPRLDGFAHANLAALDVPDAIRDPFADPESAWPGESGAAFAVDHEIELPDALAEPGSAIEELDDADATPDLVVRLAVEELANEHAEALLRAWEGGALFERCGSLVIAAWQRCRARLGAGAEPAAFRAALHARLGIDLPGWDEA